ncbi:MULTISPECIES: hypothetical protein [Pelosinus]|jgi:hypothetical protein|uniref:hypothetical protein n=1 Tax=Pelosinus TaxID=365348 RepID=UPI00138AF562|nr:MULTISPECIES: hypothetical protein [Pelosinus]
MYLPKSITIYTLIEPAYIADTGQLKDSWGRSLCQHKVVKKGASPLSFLLRQIPWFINVTTTSYRCKKLDATVSASTVAKEIKNGFIGEDNTLLNSLSSLCS